MTLTMLRNPFTRGEYERVCHGQGECAWCGQKRPRVYSYVWTSDGRTHNTALDHRRARKFCTFSCFSVFYS
jgi:hypothetical protein